MGLRDEIVFDVLLIAGAGVAVWLIGRKLGASLGPAIDKLGKNLSDLANKATAAAATAAKEVGNTAANAVTGQLTTSQQQDILAEEAATMKRAGATPQQIVAARTELQNFIAWSAPLDGMDSTTVVPGSDLTIYDYRKMGFDDQTILSQFRFAIQQQAEPSATTIDETVLTAGG